MKFAFSDIYRSPLHGLLDKHSCHRVRSAEMPSTRIVYLDLTVQGIPRVEPLTVFTPPAFLPIERAQRDAFVKEARSRYWYHTKTLNC